MAQPVDYGSRVFPETGDKPLKFMYKGGVGVKVEDCDVQSMLADGYTHHPEPKNVEEDVEYTVSREKKRPGRPRKKPEVKAPKEE